MPYPSYLPDLAPSNFVVSLDEKIPQREMFCQSTSVKQTNKMTKALQGIKTDKFKNRFEQ